MSDRDELSEVVKLLRRELEVKAIILFGSRARGDWGPWSDYDLLILADFKERYLDRIKRVLNVIRGISLPVEPHPYTLNEALGMLRKGNPLIVDALEEGRVLYATEDLEELLKAYRELKRKGLRRTGTTIIVP